MNTSLTSAAVWLTASIPSNRTFCASAAASGNEGETLLAPVREYVDREQYGGAKVRTKICKAQLGNDAGIIGAALLGK